MKINIKKFWNNKNKLLSNLIQNIFHQISHKYNLEYFESKIYIPFKTQKEHTEIIGDCYKQVLFLNSNTKYLGILRPEITYTVTQYVNHNTNNLYYISECYRNETTQFLRFQNFTQLGCEFFVQTERKKIINDLIMLSHLKNLLDIINNYQHINYYLYVNTKEEIIINFIKTTFTKCIIVLNQIKRLGGNEHNYTHLCFEIQAQIKSQEKDKIYEIIGGGSYNITYKQSTIYATGYAAGLERVIYFMSYSNNIDDLIPLVLKNINLYHTHSTINENRYIIKVKQLQHSIEQINSIMQQYNSTQFIIR